MYSLINKKTILEMVIVIIIVAIIIMCMIFKLKKISSNDDVLDENRDESVEEIIEKHTQIENSETMKNLISNCINSSVKEYYYLKEMYKTYDLELTTYCYFVYGFQNNVETFYIVSLDYKNHAFEVTQSNESEYVEAKEGNIDKKYLENNSIEKKENNSFNVLGLSEKQTAQMYYNIIKNLLNSEPEVLYNLLLDDEYKQKRFSNIENYNEFVNQNKSKYINMKLSKYAKYKYDGYVQYVCLDNNGDYFVINDNINTREYKILLDTYTIDQQEFIKKYNSATDSEKAGYDINKFFDAINANDYTYAYNCLAESFKQNKFSTQKQFENYIKNNFYNKNEVKYSNYRKEGNYYIYTVNIGNSNDTTQSIQKEFIVNLKENRQFEMSFSAE